jgi:hypothetical protein
MYTNKSYLSWSGVDKSTAWRETFLEANYPEVRDIEEKMKNLDVPSGSSSSSFPSASSLLSLPSGSSSSYFPCASSSSSSSPLYTEPSVMELAMDEEEELEGREESAACMQYCKMRSRRTTE